jgi:NTP pyrophosphatase (non-canonical NTP hydrolase)
MKIPKRVKQVSRKERKSLVSRGLKLNEEAGELAAEILKFVGEKGAKGKSKKEILADLHLEAVDCLLMAMDILVHTGASEKVISRIMNSQLNKWERNFKK